MFGAWLRAAFAEHQRALTRIADDLDGIDGFSPVQLSSPESQAEEDFLEHLQVYVAALARAVRALSNICARLASEASGNRTGPDPTFRADVRHYKDLVAEYSKLGDQLSSLYRSLP